MHDVQEQHALDLSQHLVDQRLGLVCVLGPDRTELRGRERLVAHVGHQDRVARALDGARHRGAALCEGPQGLPLAVDPDHALHLAPEARLLLERHAHAAFLDPFAVAVHRFVPEVPPVERVVRLQRDELSPVVRGLARHR